MVATDGGDDVEPAPLPAGDGVVVLDTVADPELAAEGARPRPDPRGSSGSRRDAGPAPISDRIHLIVAEPPGRPGAVRRPSPS